jgi:hypothetical protein
MSMRLLEKRLVLALAVVAGCGGVAPEWVSASRRAEEAGLTQFLRGKGSSI